MTINRAHAAIVLALTLGALAGCDGPAPRGEDIYPVLDHAAAFLCANGACSSPIPDAAALTARLAKVK